MCTTATNNKPTEHLNANKKKPNNKIDSFYNNNKNSYIN